MKNKGRYPAPHHGVLFRKLPTHRHLKRPRVIGVGIGYIEPRAAAAQISPGGFGRVAGVHRKAGYVAHKLWRQKHPFCPQCSLFAIAVGTFATGVDTFVTGVDTFVTGVDTFVTRVDAFVTGVDTFAAGVDTFVTGVDTFVTNSRQFATNSRQFATIAPLVLSAAGGLTSYYSRNLIF